MLYNLMILSSTLLKPRIFIHVSLNTEYPTLPLNEYFLVIYSMAGRSYLHLGTLLISLQDTRMVMPDFYQLRRLPLLPASSRYSHRLIDPVWLLLSNQPQICHFVVDLALHLLVKYTYLDMFPLDMDPVAHPSSHWLSTHDDLGRHSV